MNKNMMLYLVLGIGAYYLWSKSQSTTPCAGGLVNVNGQCVQPPYTLPTDTTGTTGSQIPCAPGFVPYTSGGVTSCVGAPGTDTDPIGTLLNQLI